MNASCAASKEVDVTLFVLALIASTWMPKPESHLSDSATKPCMKR
ncbi:hypothetical protein [Nostoc sp.]